MRNASGTIIVTWIVVLMAAGWPSHRVQAADNSAPRAYPEPMPEDASFETVVKSQPFPLMKYPVPIIGLKVHPEEVHVTPSGQLIFPRGERYSGPCLAVLVGSRTSGEQGSRDMTLSLPPAEGVTSKLIDGYMPGIENIWTIGDLQVRELTFATAGGKFESANGQEPLVALVRYSVTNQSASACEAVVAIQYGEEHSGQSVKTIPPAYPEALSFEPPFIRQPDGAYAACLLGTGVKASFKPLPGGPDASQYVILNEKEATVQGAEYTIEIERQGETVKVGSWQSPDGADFYLEASRGHSVPMAVDMEAIGPDGVSRPISTLYRSGLSGQTRSADDYIAPGQRSVAAPWADLAKLLPQGNGKLLLRCYCQSDAERKPADSWTPIAIFSRPGVTPRFKNVAMGAADANRLRVEFSLAAGESKTVDLAIPYFPWPKQSGRELESLRIDDELAGFRTYWGRELNRNAEFIVPETRIRDAYRACLANNLILVDRDPKTSVLMPHPDATWYEAVWAGDGSVSMQAMGRLGYHKEVENVLDYFLARQGREKPEGDVQSAEGYFSGDVDLRWMNQNGFILWALAEHYKLTRDEAWLKRVAPQMVKGCDWIVRERARTKTMENGQKVKHYGLLPKGRPSDLYIHDNWYWTDTYSYMGLRGTADVLAATALKDDAARLASEADDYKTCIIDSVERSTDPNVKPPFVPPTPYRTGPPSFKFFDDNWYTISSPLYMVEAGLLDPRGEKAGGVCHWLEQCGMKSGLPVLGEGSIDPYYVYNQSLTQLLRGEPAKFVWTLYSLNAYAMGPGTYCTIEGQNILTGVNTEAWDANRQPHMHSNSRYIDLVRIALLLEEGDTLHLMAGTPRGWLADGQGVEVKRAPSYFGEVNFSAKSRADSGEIVFKIDPPKQQAASVVLHVRPPTKAGRIKAVTINEKEWKDFDAESVKLGRLAGPADVVCRLEKAAEKAQ